MADLPNPNETEETPAAAPEEEKPETETPAPEAAPEAEAKAEESAPEGEEGEPAPEGEAEAKAEEPQAAAEEKRRRAGGWQRKIDRLERERSLLLEQLASQRPAPPPEKSEAEMTPQEKAVAYIRGEVRREMEQAEQVRQQQAAIADFQRRTAEVRAKTPDYEEVIEAAAHIGVSDAVREALLTSEHGPAMIYQLAKNPSELARISALPGIVAAREIGRLEAKLASVAPPPATKPKAALRPPAPPSSVNGSASSTRNIDDLPLAEYKRSMRLRR